MVSESSEEFGLILQRLNEIERLLLRTHVTPWMTSKEAAAFLRISTSKLDTLVAKGLIPYRRIDSEIPKSQRLFHRRDLVGYLVSGSNPQTHRLSPSEKKLVEELL